MCPIIGKRRKKTKEVYTLTQLEDLKIYSLAPQDQVLAEVLWPSRGPYSTAGPHRHAHVNHGVWTGESGGFAKPQI